MECASSPNHNVRKAFLQNRCNDQSGKTARLDDARTRTGDNEWPSSRRRVHLFAVTSLIISAANATREKATSTNGQTRAIKTDDTNGSRSDNGRNTRGSLGPNHAAPSKESSEPTRPERQPNFGVCSSDDRPVQRAFTVEERVPQRRFAPFTLCNVLGAGGSNAESSGEEEGSVSEQRRSLQESLCVNANERQCQRSTTLLRVYAWLITADIKTRVVEGDALLRHPPTSHSTHQRRRPPRPRP